MAGGRSVGNIQGTGTWVDGSIAVNPTDGATLADTGQLLQGTYLVAFSGYATVGSAYDAKQIDVASATVHTQRRAMATNTNDDFLFANKVTISTNDGFRATQSGGITGSTQVSIFYMETGN